MPLCWIFLLNRRRALSKLSFSPTRTSANPELPSLGARSRPRPPPLSCEHTQTAHEQGPGSVDRSQFRRLRAIGRTTKWLCQLPATTGGGAGRPRTSRHRRVARGFGRNNLLNVTRGDTNQDGGLGSARFRVTQPIFWTSSSLIRLTCRIKRHPRDLSTLLSTARGDIERDRRGRCGSRSWGFKGRA